MDPHPDAGRSIFSFVELKSEALVPLDPSDLKRIAILLDVDGTLLDIAPTPKEVVVTRGLT